MFEKLTDVGAVGETSALYTAVTAFLAASTKSAEIFIKTCQL